MIKAKVLRIFLDKQMNAVHPVGKVIEVSEERFEEILSAEENSLVELVDGEIIPTDPPGGNDLPIDLGSNVETLKEKITAELGKEDLELLLKSEKEGQNRKGVVKHLEYLLKEDDE
nr:hypothetical protein [Fredinandcohnia onubensis]